MAWARSPPPPVPRCCLPVLWGIVSAVGTRISTAGIKDQTRAASPPLPCNRPDMFRDLARTCSGISLGARIVSLTDQPNCDVRGSGRRPSVVINMRRLRTIQPLKQPIAAAGERRHRPTAAPKSACADSHGPSGVSMVFETLGLILPILFVRTSLGAMCRPAHVA